MAVGTLGNPLREDNWGGQGCSWALGSPCTSLEAVRVRDYQRKVGRQRTVGRRRTVERQPENIHST